MALAGRQAYLRFKCTTGDAMGMHMVGNGVDAVIAHLCERFPGAQLLALSGNFCTDKKPSAVNWIEGRGKSVAAEAVSHDLPLTTTAAAEEESRPAAAT